MAIPTVKLHKRPMFYAEMKVGEDVADCLRCPGFVRVDEAYSEEREFYGVGVCGGCGQRYEIGLVVQLAEVRR